MNRIQLRKMYQTSTHGLFIRILPCFLWVILGSGTPALAQSDETKSDPTASNPIQAVETETEQSESNQPDELVSANDFESFSLILDRNIFDPDRRGPREQRRERPPEPPREESFTLLGTMSYAEKQLAFFGGTDSDWEGAVKMGELVAGHKLIKIGFDKVEMEWEGEVILLEVGAARARRGDEAWSTKERSDWSGGSGSSGRSSRRSSSGGSFGSRRGSESSDASSSEESTPALSGDASDILKEMMERRRQSQGQ